MGEENSTTRTAVPKIELIVPQLFREILDILIGAVTGSPFTPKQIRSLSISAAGVGVRLIFDEAKVEDDMSTKIERAREHIRGASQIVQELGDGLEQRAKSLDELAQRVEEKRKEAEHFAAIADANSATLAAFRTEIEQAIRTELETRARQGRWTRRLASAIIWTLTLVLGAALGAYFLDLVAWGASVGQPSSTKQ